MFDVQKLADLWRSWQQQLDSLSQLSGADLGLFTVQTSGELHLRLVTDKKWSNEHDSAQSTNDQLALLVRAAGCLPQHLHRLQPHIATSFITSFTAFAGQTIYWPSGEVFAVVAIFDNEHPLPPHSHTLLQLAHDSIALALSTVAIQQASAAQTKRGALSLTPNVNLQQFVDSFKEHIWFKDNAGRYTLCNASVEQAWGKPRADILGKTDYELFDKRNARLFISTDHQAIEKGGPIIVGECQSHEKQGVWLETLKTPILDERGHLLGVTGITRNISSHKAAQEQLALTAQVFENAVEGVLITDNRGNITEINGAFFEITGYSRDEVIGQNPRILNSGRHDKAFFTELWSVLETEGKWQGEIWNRRKNGAIFPQYITISTVLDDYDEIQYFVAVFSDISAQKQSEAQLDYLAFHDPLTNLPNRTKLASDLEQELRHAERHQQQLATILIDVDLFKHINDSFGHLIGDEVLIELAKRLAQHLGSEDTLARIGGDEFVVLLSDIESSDAAAFVVSKLKQVFDLPFYVSSGEQLRLSASMGVSMYPSDGKDSDTLLRNADAAMYRAKHEGRNGYAFYTESLTLQSVKHLTLQSALHQAISNDAFHLVYQPKVDLATLNTVGVEALLRWVDPILGEISPAVFIPVAEQVGLIHDIGLWVLRRACEQGVLWRNSGRQFGRIAVNVAGQQLQRQGFVEEVQSVLQATGLPASCLELEVTESFMMQDPEAAIGDLKRLGDMGIALSIDDFGTGYSSLNYLKKLPIHKLKIDQSFVRDIPLDGNNSAIANAVIALGHALNLVVIAEGVETDEQAAFLRASGCDQAQGYLYSRPQLAQDLSSFF